jgi:predicted transposase YdaD
MSLQEMIMSDTTLPNTYRLGILGEKYREGKAEGKAEGKTEGHLEGMREMVIMILRKRGYEVTEAVCERIESNDDPAKLQAIADRALGTNWNLEDVLYNLD